MDNEAKSNFLMNVADVHTALHDLTCQVLMNAEPETILHAVERVEDEVRYLSV